MINYFAGNFRLYDVYEYREFIATADNLKAVKQIASDYDADTDGECDLMLYKWTGIEYEVMEDWRY